MPSEEESIDLYHRVYDLKGLIVQRLFYFKAIIFEYHGAVVGPARCYNEVISELSGAVQALVLGDLTKLDDLGIATLPFRFVAVRF